MTREVSLVTIRTAETGDAAVLAELARRTFDETFAEHNDPGDMAAYMDEAFNAGRLAAELREPGSAYLLAEDASGAVGFAKIGPAAVPACVGAPNPLRLQKLYVSAGSIGSGVGAALMRACIARARASGYASLWLGVWEHNHRARAFYGRWGFVPVGTEAFVLGADRQTDVLMQLPSFDGVA